MIIKRQKGFSEDDRTTLGSLGLIGTGYIIGSPLKKAKDKELAEMHKVRLGDKADELMKNKKTLKELKRSKRIFKNSPEITKTIEAAEKKVSEIVAKRGKEIKSLLKSEPIKKARRKSNRLALGAAGLALVSGKLLEKPKDKK